MQGTVGHPVRCRKCQARGPEFGWCSVLRGLVADQQTPRRLTAEIIEGRLEDPTVRLLKAELKRQRPGFDEGIEPEFGGVLTQIDVDVADDTESDPRAVQRSENTLGIRVRSMERRLTKEPVQSIDQLGERKSVV